MTNGGRWQCVRWLDDRYVLSLGFVHRKVGLASWHVIDTVGGEPPRRIGDGEVTCGGLLYGRPHAVVSNGGLFTHGVRRGAVHIDRYEIATGARETIVGGPRSIGSFALRGRTIVFVAAETNKLAELYERPSLRSGAAIDARERVLTNVAEPFTATVRLATLEEFETVASDGYPVHGFVCRPPGSRRAAKRTPGLLFVHGGPLSQYGWGFFDEFQLAAAAGYTVVGVNPRGSDGYGHNHADAITGDFGNLDWIDVQAAIEWLAKQPDVDPERLGIGGGSYGGFMTAWATARNHRFKVALVERAVINWSTMEATSDIGWFQQLEMGATTLTDPIRVARQSPITYVKDVRTPTLIVHSEEDWRCPIEQGEQWFVSLRRLGVPCEFVRFPGENHELTRTGRPSLRIARLRIVHEWFAKYLGGTKF